MIVYHHHGDVFKNKDDDDDNDDDDTFPRDWCEVCGVIFTNTVNLIKALHKYH